MFLSTIISLFPHVVYVVTHFPFCFIPFSYPSHSCPSSTISHNTCISIHLHIHHLYIILVNFLSMFDPLCIVSLLLFIGCLVYKIVVVYSLFGSLSRSTNLVLLVSSSTRLFNIWCFVCLLGPFVSPWFIHHPSLVLFHDLSFSSIPVIGLHRMYPSSSQTPSLILICLSSFSQKTFVTSMLVSYLFYFVYLFMAFRVWFLLVTMISNILVH